MNNMRKDQKVILVVIDGLRFQTALQYCGYLESLCAGGKARRNLMKAVLPTLSAPIYETLHTGMEPHAHGITSNDNVRLSDKSNVFSIARQNNRKTAAVAHSLFSCLYNQSPYDPIFGQEVDDPNLTIQHGRFYTEHGYTSFNFMLPSDADLMNKASMLIARNSPDYLLLHTSGCDAVGHAYGGGSDEYCKQAWNADNELAKSVPYWQAEGYRILVTADHGFTSFGHHGGSGDDVRDIPFYDIGHPIPGISETVLCQLSVAPTILSLMGLSIPVEMSGKPLNI